MQQTLRQQASSQYFEAIKRANQSSHVYACESCKDTGIISEMIDGFEYANECPTCAAKRRAAQLQKICGLTNQERLVNLNSIVASSDSDTGKMVKAARDFIANPIGILTIHGTCGNAKTVALQSIVNATLNRDVTAIYTTFFDLIRYVREAYQPGSGDSDWARMRRFQNVPVLCIDEMDKVKVSEWVAEIETQLFDVRYRRGISGECGTVFAMNGSLDSLPDHLASRLRDGRNKIVVNNDRDMRRLMR